MDHSQVFSCIEQNKARYTQFLQDICSFEATAHDKQTLDELADFIADFARELGLCVERVPFSRCGDFLQIDLNPGAPAGSVLLAHTDTVHQKGCFGTPPVRIEGERMIGPGTIDCKGGIAVALLMMQALGACGYPRNVRLLLTSDEEISNVLGGEQELAFFRERTKGFPHALNCETTQGNEVVVARRGILRYEIAVSGKGGHAGMHYFDCASPVREAAHKIVALEQSSVPGGITYSCNVVHAGTASNVIPDICRFTVDVRVVTGAQMDEADRLVRRIAAECTVAGTSATVTLLGSRPPMEKTPQGMALFEKLNAISVSLSLGELVAVESGGGSDSAYTQRAGVVSLCSLGTSGEFCHTNREYAYIPSIAARAKLLAALLCVEEGENK